MAVIKTTKELFDVVWTLYCNECVELSETYFSGIIIDMTKAELLQAYSGLQEACNGDTVVRLDNNCTPLPEEDLIPEEWYWIRVAGDAEKILEGINSERKNGGYAFARICGEEPEEMLDLLYGDFEK